MTCIKVNRNISKTVDKYKLLVYYKGEIQVTS
nr:MAG TPA: hypothetical protein [Caudoviricetes sp.]DAZ20813.1 MAG TPA: hypothetical protein [Caudoviricetes sp.]DAZ74239.1 MAG TPA: hypothetical protein [Caudoviricetes sp.]